MPNQLLMHAKRMRHAPTEAEAHLWRCLRAHRFAGFKFRRQQPIGRYIVDFVCFERRLVVEVDGCQHADSTGDQTRDGFLIAQGFRVARFWNHDVLARTEWVMDEIWERLHAEPHPLPGRLRRPVPPP